MFIFVYIFHIFAVTHTRAHTQTHTDTQDMQNLTVQPPRGAYWLILMPAVAARLYKLLLKIVV